MVLAVLVVTAVAYVAATILAARLGRSHSPMSTVAFVGGLAVLALALRARWGGYDEDMPWVHDAQHALIMGVAPPLLALGAPVRLCLAVLPTLWARRLVGVLHLRPLRALCGPMSAAHVPIDYYGVMAVYLFTSAAALSERNAAAHVASHAVFLVCGLLFWVPVIGADVAGWRPDRRTSIALVTVGIPLYAVFALATGRVSLLVVNEVATAIGLLLVLVRRRAPATPRRRAPAPAATAATAAPAATAATAAAALAAPAAAQS